MFLANKLTAKLVLTMVFSGIVIVIAQAQTSESEFGRIEGKVTEAITGEELIGVNVMIVGTSLGDATRGDGSYIIRRVPAGTHTIIVSYIGYKRIEEEIEVIGGETLQYDIVLEQQTLEGEEITISSQAEGQRQAINEQLSSREIKNVVSAEKIRELPDESAATALSRLPGISLQDGDKVVVRGIQAKYNTVMINGIQLPATGLGDRSTNLGFISSNMLSGIEVTKAVTPDMDANSIGGTINLKLQEAPEGFHSDFMLQGDYNTQNNTYNNYQVWASVSNRFFDNKLGAFAQVNARRLDGGQHIGNAIYSKQADPGYNLAEYSMTEFEYIDNINVNQELGGSIILDYELPNGKLMLQNTYANTIPENTRHLDRLVLAQGNRRFRVDRNLNTKHLVINALQGEQTIGEDLDLKVRYGVSHSASQQDSDLNYWIEFTPATHFEDLNDLFVLTHDDIYDIEYFENYSFDQNQSNNAAVRSDEFTERHLVANLDLILPVNITPNISGEIQGGGKIKQLNRENDVARWFARLSEGNNNRDARDFLENVVGMENWNTTLPFELFRDNDYERGEYFLGGLYDMRDVINTNWMDQYMRLAPTGWPRGENPDGGHIADSRRSDFLAEEIVSAAYLMGDFKLGSKLNVLFGARYENFHMDYEATYMFQNHFDGNGREITPAEQDSIAGQVFSQAERTVDHLLPNLQLRYNATDWFDIRFAYTKTLSRPDYSQLLPSIYVDGSSNRGYAGNPNLKPTVSQNFDLYFSFYNNAIGLFTVGGFYKQMDDVILSQTIVRRDLPLYAESVVWPDPELDLPNIGERRFLTTFVNNECPDTDWAPESCPAIVRGIEFDWQTHFWYLPKPFNNMVFNANYTRSFSEMDYRQIINNPIFDPITGQGDVEVTDTLRTARLLHQGDHVVNVALGADYKGFSGRISFRLQSDVITNVAGRPEEDAFTGNVYSWDFTIRQKLPVEGLSLFANGINITHAPTKDYQEFRRDVELESPSRNLRRIAYNPRRFQLGIRYSL